METKKEFRQKNAGTIWTSTEESELRIFHERGATVSFMAYSLGRTQCAIECHLKHLGLEIPE